jgi:lysophospholipase L1-like esterase
MNKKNCYTYRKSAGKKYTLLCFTFLCLLMLARAQGHAQDPARFEKEIRAFEIKDSLSVPRANAVLFIGSSTIRRWDSLDTYFKGRYVINRGFGGSHASDLLFYFKRITASWKSPRQILIYEGDNDIAAGKNTDSVLHQLVSIANLARITFPAATLTFLAVKPCPARWKYRKEIEYLNGRLKSFAHSEKDIQFVDVYHPVLNEYGRPTPAFFVADSVHMTAKGYQVWADRITPHLK